MLIIKNIHRNFLIPNSNMKYLRNRFSNHLSTASYYGTNESSSLDKPLLITHGLLGSKQNWNSLANHLKSKFKKVVTVDLRNHGESPHVDEMSFDSMVDDFKQLIIENNYHNCILMGHSFGGKIAMYLALKEPQLLSALVAVDVSPVYTSQISQFKAYINAMISAPIDQNVSLPLNRKIIDDYLKKSVPNPEIRSFLLANLFRNEASNEIKWRANLPSILLNLDKFISFPKFDDHKFDKPVLFIGGKQSDYIRPEHWPIIKNVFPSASLSMIEGAGHWVHADKPFQFLEVLVRFGVDCHGNR